MGSEQKSLSVLASAEVMSQIDMKLSKSDLIDMLVEEKRSLLEDKMKVLSDEKAGIDAEVKSKAKDLEKLLAKTLLAKNKKLISASKSAYPGAVVSDDYGRRSETGVKLGVSTCSAELITLVRETDEDNKAKLSFKARVIGSALLCFRSPPIDRRSGAELDLRLQVCESSLSKSDMSKFEEFAKEKAERLNAISNELNMLQTEKSELTKKGSKARAELTKKLLEQSEGGRQLLETMKSVKKNLNF